MDDLQLEYFMLPFAGWCKCTLCSVQWVGTLVISCQAVAPQRSRECDSAARRYAMIELDDDESLQEDQVVVGGTCVS